MNPVEIQLQVFTERLGHLEGFRSRKMFGGASLYSEEVVFCMITKAGIPHFRIGDNNLQDYLDAGQKPFSPGDGKGKMKKGGKMPYYTIPEEVMADQIKLEAWAAKAITASKKAKGLI